MKDGNTSYTLTGAATKRIAAGMLAALDGHLHYANTLDAAIEQLKVERVYAPNRSVADLIVSLDDDGFHGLAISLGRSAASRWNDLRKEKADLVAALFPLFEALLPESITLDEMVNPPKTDDEVTQ